MKVTVAGNWAYVADGPGGLRVIDVASATAPTDVTAYDTPGYAYDVQVADSLAYVADGTGGLRIIDLSDPEEVLRGRRVPPAGRRGPGRRACGTLRLRGGGQAGARRT